MSRQIPRRRPGLWFVLCTQAVLVISASGRTAAFCASPPASDEDRRAVAQAKSLSRAFRRAAQSVSPSVVKIETRTPRRVARRMAPSMGTGTGTIIDAQGIVLTSHHVVAGTDEVVVQLADGRRYDAVEIRTDADTDLAIVRIEPGGPLPVAEFGPSEALEIGDWVIAVGHPFDLDQTVSAGIISAKTRRLDEVGRAVFLQTDAAINPGNSGGPLVNLDGQVIGVTTAIKSSSGGYQGIGFAVPSELAGWIARQLIEYGQVERAYLGVGVNELTADIARILGVEPASGLLVARVFSGSPAGAAGIKEGDLITHFGNRHVSESRDLQEVVERSTVGSIHTVRAVRGGRTLSLEVTVKRLAENPEDVAVARSSKTATAARRQPSNALGLQVIDLPEGFAAAQAEDTAATAGRGVLVSRVDPRGTAYEVGLRPGMLILRVGGRDVRSQREFARAMSTEARDSGVLVLARTLEGDHRYYPLQTR